MKIYYLPVPVPAFLDYLFVAPLLLYRKICSGSAYRKIYLTNGMVAKVSQRDFENVNQYKWRAKKNSTEDLFYAIRIERINGAEKHFRMHRVIMNPPSGFVVDHKDGDGLNNTRDNLRIVTIAQNTYNMSKRSGTSSIYKGVHREKRNGRYRAMISYRGYVIRLGSFENEIDAAKAYDDAAKDLFGEYAKLNFN
ncbi:MAG: HNH endonuclease signature motif containing protein [Sedimentisphaerales bacterium]